MERTYQPGIFTELAMPQSMPDVPSHRLWSSPPWNRREFLRIGSLMGLGIGLPQLGGATKAADFVRHPAKACILIWLDGGPSHIDTFDPKPAAPTEVRGPFQSIQTRVAGVRFSELFPQLADRADRLAVVRSLTSPLGEHNLGTQYWLTGYRPSPVIEYPSFVSVLAQQQREHSEPGLLPNSVAIPDFRVGGGAIDPVGFLASRFAPFSVDSDPAKPGFSVRNLSVPDADQSRLHRRQRFRRWMAGEAEFDPLTEQAFALLSSSQAQEVFQLDSEPAEVRSRYGMKTIGQSCLLARRLVEAGIPLVSVIDRGWDTHNDVVTRLRDGFTGAKVPVGLGPSLDRALAALMDDLQERGLWRDTMVVVMGEFGRTPKWNAGGGRDHWPRVFSGLLAGGPIAPGVVYGSSDRTAESVADLPVTPADLTHTIYAAMGLDSSQLLPTPDGRPIAMADPQGRVIEELLA